MKPTTPSSRAQRDAVAPYVQADSGPWLAVSALVSLLLVVATCAFLSTLSF